MSFSSTTSSPPASSIHSDSEGSYVLVPRVKVLKSVVNGPIANSVQSSLGLENASEEELVARINSLKTENEDLKEVLQKNNNVLQVCCRYIFNFNLSLSLCFFLWRIWDILCEPHCNRNKMEPSLIKGLPIYN